MRNNPTRPLQHQITIKAHLTNFARLFLGQCFASWTTGHTPSVLRHRASASVIHLLSRRWFVSQHCQIQWDSLSALASCHSQKDTQQTSRCNSDPTALPAPPSALFISVWPILFHLCLSQTRLTLYYRRIPFYRGISFFISKKKVLRWEPWRRDVSDDIMVLWYCFELETIAFMGD